MKPFNLKTLKASLKAWVVAHRTNRLLRLLAASHDDLDNLSNWIADFGIAMVQFAYLTMMMLFSVTFLYVMVASGGIAQFLAQWTVDTALKNHVGFDVALALVACSVYIFSAFFAMFMRALGLFFDGTASTAEVFSASHEIVVRHLREEFDEWYEHFDDKHQALLDEYAGTIKVLLDTTETSPNTPPIHEN
jgi:hypothetical protein